MRHIMGLALIVTLSACGTTPQSIHKDHDAGRLSSSPISWRATLRDAQGVAHGVAVIGGNTQLQLTMDINALSPGLRGVHLHSVGTCEGPSFTSAGPHWNPTAKHHGRDNPAGMHSGDLPNVDIGTNGRGMLVASVPGTIADVMDADGASIIVHAAADDYRTDPSGNSGARQLCGVFERR